jgi:hypothetical protein
MTSAGPASAPLLFRDRKTVPKHSFNEEARVGEKKQSHAFKVDMMVDNV